MILVDTNILLRVADPASAACGCCRNALTTLRRRGEKLHAAPQVMYEFWVSGTKPKTANGLGMTAGIADQWLNYVSRLLPVLDETDEVLPTWRELMRAHQVTGVRAHDARLVAMMKVHGLQRLMTLNTADFQKYSITLIDPASIT